MTQNYQRVNEAKKILMNQIEQDRISLLERAKHDGVKVVHIFNAEFPRGGITVAFRKCKPSQISTNMVDIAISTCSQLDSFDRKKGTMLALRNWYAAKVVSLPLSSGYAYEDLSKRVKNAFTALYRMR